MTEQLKVYLVTQGDYSDYHVEAVFSTKGKAQAWIDSSRKWSCVIEEWELDNAVEWGYVTFVIMKRDGALWGHSESVLPRWARLPPHPYHLFPHAGEGCYLLQNWVFTGKEKGPVASHCARALKVTNELRVRLIATDEWPDE